MILEYYERPSKRWGMKRPHRCLRLKCDTCGKVWETTAYAYASKREHHTCSRACSAVQRRKGGLVHRKQARTCMQRYGVENAAQAQTIKEKIEKTCLKKYGVKASFQAPEVKEKISVSLNAHYGVDHPMHVDEVKAKLKKTFRDRYGGILHGSQALSRKIKTTMLDRYGVEHPLQSDEIKLNFPWKTRARNIHNTMKRNGTYSRQASCAEAKFHELLTKKFGNDEVERHVVVNGWCIDFYVSAIDVYIQFDGVYWHGLDRPIDVIKQSDRPRDQIIYKTWLRDREQNVWFEQNNKKLYRVTDMQDMHAEVEKIHSGHTNRRQTWR